MTDYISKMQNITWTSPKGKSYIIKALESGYSRKHIGEIKENPKASSKDSKNNKKRISDSNDTFCDLGIGGKNVALDCIFSGANHDIEAKAFADSLCEVGKSKLRLAYGDEFTVNVLDFSVKNNHVQNINRTVVSVNFHQTASTTYPSSSQSQTNKVKAQVEKANTIAAQNFESAVGAIAKNQTRMSAFTASYSKMMGKVSSALSAANSVSVQSIMTDLLGQDVMSNAYTMTSQLQIAISQAIGLSSSVQGFKTQLVLPENLGQIKSSLVSLMGGLKNSGTKSPLQTQQIDELISSDTTAQAVINAFAQNTVETEYTTRKEAIAAVNELLSVADDWNEYVEDEYQKIDDMADAFVRDSGINEVVLSAIDAVIEKSYDLKVEKSFILTEDDSTVNLAYLNYPVEFEIDAESTIEYLISSNGWGDDLFYLVPKGTEVKIYV